MLVETVADNVVRLSNRWLVDLQRSTVIQFRDPFALALFVNLNLLWVNLLRAAKPCLCYSQYFKLGWAVFVEKVIGTPMTPL